MTQLGELRVSDCMTEQAIVVQIDDELTVAVRLMEQHHFSAMPVVDSLGKVVGILSTSDVLQVTHELQSDISSLAFVSKAVRRSLVQMLIDENDTTRVGNVMSTPVETVGADMNLVVAAKLLIDKHCHHLPVTSDDGKVVGMLSTTDFVHAIAKFGSLAVG